MPKKKEKSSSHHQGIQYHEEPALHEKYPTKKTHTIDTMKAHHNASDSYNHPHECSDMAY